MIKKLKILWAIACTSSSIDQNSNVTSLFNVLEQVQFSTSSPEVVKNGIPENGTGIPFPFDIVALIARPRPYQTNKELQLEIKLKLTDPEGKILITNDFPAVIDKDKKRLRFNIRFNGMTVTKNGEYIFTLSVKEKDTESFVDSVEIPLDVTLEFISPYVVSKKHEQN